MGLYDCGFIRSFPSLGIKIIWASHQEDGIFAFMTTELKTLCKFRAKINVNILYNSGVKPSRPGALSDFRPSMAIKMSFNVIGLSNN